MSTQLLAELIDRRRHCLGQLRELGLRQLELITADDLSHLLDVLAGKQRLLVELQTIERALDPFRSEDPAARVWASPGNRERCARAAADCETLLAEIVELEQRGEAEMSRRRDQTARSLQHVHAAGAARGAYASDSYRGARQLDLSSEK